MPKLPSSLTTVTTFSKILAVVLFFTFIIAGFFAGMKYQAMLDLAKYQQVNLVESKPSPTLDSTASWKTYVDTAYNFSIKYPQSWENPRIDKVYFDNSNYHIEFADPKPFTSNIRINILPNPNKLSSQEYVKTEAFKNQLPGWDNDKQITNFVNISGIETAIRIEEIVGGAGVLGPVAYIATDKNIINIENLNFNESNRSLFNQILSTFKFTDSATVITSPTPTCRPRPACLDGVPRCMIPETSDMCPRTTPTTTGKQCGGIAGILCPTGYECQLDGKYPDAAGKCIKQ